MKRPLPRRPSCQLTAMVYSATFWRGTAHEVQLVLGDPTIHPGLDLHRLAWSLKLLAGWLDSGSPNSYVRLLLTGGVWLDQPEHRWLAEVQPLT